ncbi:D-cysteine desulfhydrase [Dethiosulfatarculus sandiegensis]|uniref:Cytochrome C biogenesis protein CcmE n=1 Tax=Dethiosulfatarculus sandiegensis TaxID=1429043 RepID=A0A0D2GCT8_9BACT|nr:D-cysteine desulfhydrase [Dethiosulfatarculus sandiegensis]KIX12777.1 cytochrome C biogenesis protein CcmE [Dethiosulfatarculus sandiegensis]
MNLARFPRRRYTVGQTPIEKLNNLTTFMGGPEIYMKRDDMLGLAAGGNKTRKLEFVVADALAQGADTLITCGAVQSNHCRLTLAAAAKEGIKCRLVLEERVAGSYRPRAMGNNLIYRLMGVEEIIVVPGGSDMAKEMQKVADGLKAQSRKPYVIPGGASNTIGATGYVACAEEILNQSFEMGIKFDRVVCPSGSAGTHAGLVVGFFGNNSQVPVVGVNVSRTKEDQEKLVYDLAKATALHVGVREELPREEILCFGDYVGPGYSLPTDSMVDAVRTLAKTEAILLDPVYTGKAMAGMLDLIRTGFFKKDEKVLFVHTGGSPALHVYEDSFME